MNDGQTTLIQAIRIGSAALKDQINWANPTALLGALAEVESSFGAMNIARFEKAYSIKGRYFTADQRQRWNEWGDLASCSYSSFQIMYPTACELGFDSDPWKRNPTELFNDVEAMPSVIQYIKKRMLTQGVQSVGEFADAWNTGNARDANIPTVYVMRFVQAYESVLENRNL